MSPAKELPAWYHRVRALEVSLKEVGKGLDEDVFDEDLSDPEPDSDADDDALVIRCDMSDHDSDCGCPSPDASDDDMDQDGLSERSYNGPDADDYYRLKYLREDRKRELIEIKEEQEEIMEGDLEEEAIMVKKIQAAIKAVQKAESRDAPAPFKSIANTTFHVYCVDYVKHCFCEWARGRKYVEFSYRVPDKDYGFKAKQPPNSDTKIEGQIYLTNDQCVHFEKWPPPKEAGPTKYSIKDETGKYEFTFHFISNDYLIATVPREFAFLDGPVDPRAPKTFTMYGVRYDFPWVKKKNLTEAPRLSQYDWKT